MTFTEKIVLVTGAAQGIGREICRQFAAAGATVALHFNSSASEATRTIESLQGDQHKLYQADITNPDETRSLIDAVVADFGRLDVLVNNAAVIEDHPIMTVDYEAWQQAWRRTIDANLIGAANLCYCAGRQMVRQGGGRIINVSSRGAFRGEPGMPAYGASKAGLNSMSQSLAQALGPQNVFVYVVAPGFVETERVADRIEGAAGEAIRSQSPLNRVAKPEEVAKTVLFLASEGTDFLTGCIVDINGASYLRT
jgi:3-oxoacyl-[acyl-carrier protein] reductase